MVTERRGPLPGRLRVIQARRERGVVVGYTLTLPKELCEDLGWNPGDVMEVKRKGAHVELHLHEQWRDPARSVVDVDQMATEERGNG